MIEVSKGEGGLLWYWVAILSFVSHFFWFINILSAQLKFVLLGDSYHYL